jgi:hypothetical protein
MSIDLPSYDPGCGIITRRGGRLVETWNLPNGVAWRDPALAERAVAAWHERQGVELGKLDVRTLPRARVILRLEEGNSRPLLPRVTSGSNPRNTFEEPGPYERLIGA